MNRVIDYISERIEELTYKSSESGFSVTTTDFDLNSFDYLFKASSLINIESTDNIDSITKNEIVHYLKTAIECQIDTLLNSYCIEFKKLNLPNKLNFIKKLNLIASSNIVELNKIRNKTIHEYQIAKITEKEIQLYYDIAYSLIWSIQPILTIIHQNRGIKFNAKDGYLTIYINEFQPTVTYYIEINGKGETIEEDLRNNPNLDAFAEYIKIHLLMSQFESFRNKRTILKLIKNCH